MNLLALSVQQIRRQFLRENQPVTPHFLETLRQDRREGVRKIHEILKKRYDRERAERLRIHHMLHFERVLWQSGLQSVAGVDEVGVGPLAGPVAAAAVVFPSGIELAGMNDSKRLDPKQREKMEAAIRAAAAAIGIGLADVGEIDRLNIYHAALLAMRRAVEALPSMPEHLLIDARIIPGLAIPQNAFIKGDATHFSIAAASIIAKTHRDRLMDELDRQYPGYGFARHKGYGTPEHLSAIRALGPSPVHRMSFPVIHELCGGFSKRFYRLKEALVRVESVASLNSFEDHLKDHWSKLKEKEQRKIKLMIARRRKNL